MCILQMTVVKRDNNASLEGTIGSQGENCIYILEYIYIVERTADVQEHVGSREENSYPRRDNMTVDMDDEGGLLEDPNSEIWRQWPVSCSCFTAQYGARTNGLLPTSYPLGDIGTVGDN